jgi:hypothetical protein
MKAMWTKKKKHARKNQKITYQNQQLHSVERTQTLKQRISKQTNPPPSAVGFTHSGDEAPLVRK